MHQCFLLLGFALAIGSAVAVALDEAVDTAFVEDDECLAGGPEGCSLSALQLRAQKEREEAVIERTPSNASLLEAGEEAFPFTPQCFSFTGGTCVSAECDKYRQATCSAGKCLCTGCAGVDGKCYRHNNKRLVSKVLFRNSKYDNSLMYFQRLSTFGQMKTTSFSTSINMDQDRFDIYEIPGTYDDGHKGYFLASSKWTNYVVGMKATTGTALSPFAAYAVNLGKKASILDLYGPSNIMLQICETASGTVQVGAKMGGVSTIWAYVHHGSWFVYGSLTSPGSGGEWVLEPPVPKGTFSRC